MKKMILFMFSLIFLFGFLFYNEVQASSEQRGITDKGIKIGINLSGFNGTSVSQEVSRKFGFTLGGYLTYNLSDTLAIQPEIYYTMRGAKLKEVYYNTVHVSYSVTLSYIEIPILAKLAFPNRGGIMPNIFVGPFFSITLSGKEKGDGWEEDVEDLRGYDYGLVIGAGIKFPLAKNDLNIDVRYDVGLATIDADENPKFRENIKNNSFSILIGYGF